MSPTSNWTASTSSPSRRGRRVTNAWSTSARPMARTTKTNPPSAEPAPGLGVSHPSVVPTVSTMAPRVHAAAVATAPRAPRRTPAMTMKRT